MPWASTASMSCGVRRAFASASRITRSCEGPLGAVRPLEAPSWLTAEPRIVASTVWPLRSASERRSSASMPTPSAQPTPSALSEKALQRPSRERPRWRLRPMKTLGLESTVTPPASARETLAPAQRLGGEVHRDQRGRAGRVEGDRRPLEAERVGDAAGDDAARRAGDQVALEAVGDAGHAGRVVLVHHPGEDAGRRRAQRGRVQAGVLQRLPADFEQEPLLGVHRQRLARADLEEAGVELPRVVDEAALADVEGARLVGVGVVEALGVPTAVGGEVADAVAALGDQLPELPRRADAPRIAAGHADDRDRLVAVGVQPLALLRELDRDAFEIAAQLLLISHSDPPLPLE